MKKLLAPLGVLLLLALTAPLSLAQEAAATVDQVNQAVGNANTAWIMAATALVLFMTLPGLALFYGGLVQKKNVLSVLMHCFVMACVLTIVWVVAGYSLALTEGNAWIGGLGAMFGNGLTTADSGGDGIPDILTFGFQMTFFIITPALIIGTFVERVKFSAVLLFTVLWGLLCYVPICHMVWGGGWMAEKGVIDLAGGVVVHITAGVAALIFCIMVGPRKNPQPPHNLAMCFIGTCMLWVGWFGFNGGSWLTADGASAMALVVTHISAATGALTWMLIEVITTKKPTVLGICTGSIAGLAAITPAAGVAGPMGALLIGATSGAVCWFFSVTVKNKLGYDDSLDVVGVHGVGGLVGTILAAVVAVKGLQGTGNGDHETYNMGSQLGIQLMGSAFTIVFTAVVTVIILVVIKATVGLRVDEADEQLGLDQASHGETAYND